jgi:hypothetical protein
MAFTKLSAAINLAFRDTALTKGSGLKNLYIQPDDSAGDPIVRKRPAVHTATYTSTATRGEFHGAYLRNYTPGYRFPPDTNDLNTTYLDVLNKNIVVDSNSKGQFLIGASGTAGTTGAIYYAENNNINNWIIAQEMDSNDYVKDFAYDFDNDLWLAITFAGKIWTCDGSDLSSWTDRGQQFSTAGYGITYCPGFTDIYIAVGSDATGDIQTSSDAATWTDRDNTDEFYCVDASASGAVAGGNGGIIYTSTDGVTWTSRTNPVGSVDVNKVIYNEYSGRWVLAMDNGHMAYTATVTPQPTSFTDNSNAMSDDILSLSCSYSDTNAPYVADYVACGIIGQEITYSDDGITFTDANWPIEGSKPSAVGWAYVHRVANMYHPEGGTKYDKTPIGLGYIAFSNSGYIASSPDGRNWYLDKAYKQVYYSSAETLKQFPLEDTSVGTYSATISSQTAANEVIDYTRAYFAEGTINDTPTMMVLWPAVTADLNGGTMGIIWGNSSMQPFHGLGGGDAASVLEYPFTKESTEGLAHGIVAMDGYFFIMTTKGDIYHSTLNKPEAWPALNKISAQVEGDNGVAIAKHNNNLIAFGDTTTEFFYNAGNPSGSVLNRREDIRYSTGMAAPNTMDTLDNVTVFVGQDNEYEKGVYAVQNFKLVKLSNEYIDKYLKQYAAWGENDTERHIGKIVEWEGQPFYFLTLQNSTDDPKTFVYDFNNKVWYNWYVQDKQEQYTWYSAISATSDHMDIMSAFTDRSNQTYVMFSDGDIWEFDKSVYQDFGTTNIESIVQFPTWENKNIRSGNRERHRSVHFIGDKASATDNITISWSDDDYQNFSSGKTVDTNLTYPRLHNLGSPRRRAYKVLHANNSDFGMNGLELEFKQNRR